MTLTECNSLDTRQLNLFQVKNKPVIVSNTNLEVSSNAGFLAMGKMDRNLELIESIIHCFKDAEKNRKVKAPERVQHSLSDLLKQRVYQIGLGYEDGLDADDLRHDTILQLSVGKKENLGSQPMMSRLENWVSSKDMYRAWRSLVKVYAQHFHQKGKPVVIEVDSTDDPVHGQLGLFNGYYDEHCFHPLLLTDEATGFPFGIILRDGKVSSAHNSKVVLKRLIRWLREEMEGISIIIKADCSFGVGELINFFKEVKVDYVLGLSGNSFLYRETAELEKTVLHEYKQSGKPLQRFMSFTYRAGSWDQPMSVVAKVEHTSKGLNKRFVVSSMSPDDPACLYQTYQRRAKGIEAIIEQLKNGLRFDKTACHKKLPNQMRYFESALALILHLKLIEKAQELLPEHPTVQSMIQKVLKVAGIVRKSMRRFFIQLSSCDPHTRLLMHVLET